MEYLKHECKVVIVADYLDNGLNLNNDNNRGMKYIPSLKINLHISIDRIYVTCIHSHLHSLTQCLIHTYLDPVLCILTHSLTLSRTVLSILTHSFTHIPLYTVLSTLTYTPSYTYAHTHLHILTYSLSYAHTDLNTVLHILKHYHPVKCTLTHCLHTSGHSNIPLHILTSYTHTCIHT